MPGIPKIALILETHRSSIRGIVRGIFYYSKLYGPWRIYQTQPFYLNASGSRQALQQICRWQPDGIIADIPNRKTLEKIKSIGVPFVGIPYEELFEGIPCVVDEHGQAGVLAAEHLLDRGFRHFAYCGFSHFYWSDIRAGGFQGRLAKEGYKVIKYDQPQQKNYSWQKEQSLLIKWLRSLPKPIGIMACNDDRGQHIMEACRLAGVHVPEEVAVIGVDNDPLICDICIPPLSSVSLNFDKAGFECARALDHILEVGNNTENNHVVVQAMNVIARQSTHILAMEDRDVAHALRYIRQHIREPVQVNDLVEEMSLSRHVLYKKFKTAIGRSIHEEIRRTRIEEVAHMLIQTRLSISQIASLMGYESVKHFARVFRKEKGMTPLAYRKQYQQG